MHNPVNTLRPSIKEESLLINGNGFKEVTEAAEVMALDFRDNFDQHSAAVPGNRKSMGWRNEKYGIYEINSSPIESKPLFEMERSFCKYLGIKTFGVHVNCYYRQGDEIFLWVGQRSPTKQTYPDLFDNCFAGGFTAGLSADQILVKEAEEEASIPAYLCKNAKFIGTLECTKHAPDRIEPECEFIYDIELPPDFAPTPSDGEMEAFHRVNLNKEKFDLFTQVDKWKPNCYAISLDFAIRHGIFNIQDIHQVGVWRRLMNNTSVFKE